MMKVSLPYHLIASKLNATQLGDGSFSGCVSIDTRTLKPGDLFVALRGPNYDGHDYITQAIEGGASALLVEEAGSRSVPQLVVKDSRIALGALSKLWREQFSIPVIAITGSNGKTTVKEMLSSILSVEGEMLFTAGNLNNDVGVPLTLLRLRETHKFAVIEMGANHAGEIRYLAKLAQPNVTLITNAAAAHLEGFVNIEGVAKAKSEIYQGLTEEGVSIINDDDAYSSFWQSCNRKCKRLLFSLGQNKQADVYGESLQARSLLIRILGGDEFQVNLKLLGDHNARNALAATAAAVALGVGKAQIKIGLEAMSPIKGRLALITTMSGVNVLDDTYNANPTSLSVAINVLLGMPGESWLVLGDMGELGESAERLHYEMGEQARELGVSRLYTLGELAAMTAEGFGEGAYAFYKYEDLVDALTAGLRKGINVLIKGSRAMHMERIVVKLQTVDDVQGTPHSPQRYH